MKIIQKTAFILFAFLLCTSSIFAPLCGIENHQTQTKSPHYKKVLKKHVLDMINNGRFDIVAKIFNNDNLFSLFTPKFACKIIDEMIEEVFLIKNIQETRENNITSTLKLLIQKGLQKNILTRSDITNALKILVEDEEEVFTQEEFMNYIPGIREVNIVKILIESGACVEESLKSATLFPFYQNMLQDVSDFLGLETCSPSLARQAGYLFKKFDLNPYLIAKAHHQENKAAMLF